MEDNAAKDGAIQRSLLKKFVAIPDSRWARDQACLPENELTADWIGDVMESITKLEILGELGNRK